MSEKAENPARLPLNFNLQGSISFGEKPPSPPKPPPSPPVIVVILKFAFPITFAAALYLTFFLRPIQPPVLQPPLTGGDLGLKEYTILVGSFAKEEEAKAAASQLRAARINNFIASGQDKWHVCVGKYSSAKRANSDLENLKNRGWTEAVILPPKS
jgi:hypothetical protein